MSVSTNKNNQEARKPDGFTFRVVDLGGVYVSGVGFVANWELEPNDKEAVACFEKKLQQVLRS